MKISWTRLAEPYLMLSRKDSPLYPEELAERQMDKMPYMYELHLRRLVLWVILGD